MRIRAMLRVPMATFACAVVLLSSGCWEPPPPTDDQTERGLVYMLPGMGGNVEAMGRPYKALRDGGVESEIRVLDWSRGLAALANLTDYASNLARCAEIAAEIATYHEAYPDAPVDIVGYSAGGGLAVLIAELLPEDCHLRNVVLVHAAISPDYDLEPALSHIDGELVNFYSPADWLILGVGTEIFGTIDRTYTASAGKTGFNLQRAVAGEQSAAKVEQVCWVPEMGREGHFGLHATMFSYDWNKEYVAPYMLTQGTGR
jgi:pimeloyl-ACP methyl ester carboxylesterase